MKEKDAFFAPGGYPANYFGKGTEFILPDDPAVLREFEIRFQEYEAAHPNDPMGEAALLHDKSTPTKQTKVVSTEEKSYINIDSEKLAELELVLPVQHIDLLKRYCRFVRRRPRDVVMLWIDRYCKL